MRVQAVDRMPASTVELAATLADAGAGRAMQNFLSVIGSEDSLFRVDDLKAAPLAGSPEQNGCYSGDIVLGLRSREQARDRSLHFVLLEKVTELLKAAGSQESLTATLCLSAASQSGSKQEGLALWLRLEATGESLDQAGLRWSLGLAHVQQALLFASRYLRHHLTQGHI